MINILQIVKRYSGNYPLLNEIAKLDPARFKTVVCYLGGRSDGKNQIDKLSSRTFYLGYHGSQMRWYNYRLISELKKIIESENIHVINCHLNRTAAPGVIAALLASRRPVALATLHGIGSAKSIRRKFSNWLLYRKTFRIIGVSEAVRRDILATNWALYKDKVATVYNGLNFSPFPYPMSREEARKTILPGVKGTCWFGTVGRLSKVKNHRNLILAFKKVVDVAPNCILLVVGQGQLEQPLKDLVRSLGIERKLFFLGYRKDIPMVLRALDVFVLPSLREGFCLSLLEAMASGLPVIASRVGGIPEVAGDGQGQRLIDPMDHDELARSMIDLANASEQVRLEMGHSARERALTHFSAARMVKGYEDIYEEAYRYWTAQKGY